MSSESPLSRLIDRCFDARKEIEVQCHTFYTSIGRRLSIAQKDDATCMRLIVANYCTKMRTGRVDSAVETRLKVEFLAQRRLVNQHAEVIKRLANSTFLVSRQEEALVESETELREKLVEEEENAFQEMGKSVEKEFLALKLLVRRYAELREYDRMEQVFDTQYNHMMKALESFSKGPAILDAEGFLHRISLDAFQHCAFAKGGFCDDASEDEIKEIVLPVLTQTAATVAVLEYLETVSFVASASEINLNGFRTKEEVRAFVLKPWEEKFQRNHLQGGGLETFQVLAAAQYFEVESLANLCLLRTIRSVWCFEDLKGWCMNHAQHLDESKAHGESSSTSLYDRQGETECSTSSLNSNLLFHQSMRTIVDFFSRVEQKKHSVDDAWYGHYQYLWKR